MGATPAFHLFRFPIHIRAGFLAFLALVVLVHPNEFGVWLAGSAAVLTLLHELGHAFAARATGAEAEISLDLLAGYASFEPTRELKRWERAGISLSGPATQIGVGIAVLFAMGADPLDVSFGDSPAVQAIRWTGPVMGLFNLVPVLPLDGGHIAEAALDLFLPGRSRTVMLWFSAIATIAVAAYLFATPRYQSLAYIALFPLLVQLQMISSRRGGGTRRPEHLDRLDREGPAGEARAWSTGDVSAVPTGFLPSPWFRADQQLRAGDPDVARALLLQPFGPGEDPDWWMPVTAPPARLAALVDLLPRPLPHVDAYHDLTLVAVLQRIGRHEDAVRFAAECFTTTRRSIFALAVAQSAAVLDSAETAIAWLHAAAGAARDPDALAEQMDQLPELAALRPDPRYERIRAGLRAG